MWGSVLVLIIAILSWNCFALLGVYAQSNHNEEEKNMLCRVLKTATKVLHNTDGKFQKNLYDAIYGSPKTNVLIGEDGRLSPSLRCRGTLEGRRLACNYFRRGPQSHRGDGCFSESFVGTLMCICSPVVKGTGNLCGIDVSDYGNKTWSGGFSGVYTTELFKNVLEKVIKPCTKVDENGQDYSKELENLRKVVEEVRKKVEENKSGGNLYFLGGSGADGCGGTNINDACAGYQEKNGKVDIPWAQLIEDTIPKLQVKMEKYNRPVLKNFRSTSETRAADQPVAPREASENVDSTIQPGHTQDNAEDQTKEERDETVFAEGTRNSETATKSGAKRNPQRKPLTDIPHLATDTNGDGCFIKSPIWPQLAALLI